MGVLDSGQRGVLPHGGGGVLLLEPLPQEETLPKNKSTMGEAEQENERQLSEHLDPAMPEFI